MLSWLAKKLRRDAEITGHVAELLRTIGTTPESPEMTAARRFIGTTARVQDDGSGEVYDASGVLFTHRDGRVRSFMLRTQPFEDRTVYPTPELLIDGLDPWATPEEAEAVLGRPWDVEGEDRYYAVNGADLLLEFRDGRIATIIGTAT